MKWFCGGWLMDEWGEVVNNGLLDGIDISGAASCDLFIEDGEVYIVNEWGEILFCDYLH